MRYVAPREIVIDDQPTPAPFWAPDRAFAGRTVVLIGGGPSHAALDLALLAGRRFIAINSGCRKTRPVATAADLLYFTDNSWHENRPELAAAWPGPVVTGNRNVKIRLGEAVRYLDVTALTAAIGTRADFVQASSGHIAACLAVVMGAWRLVLIGFEAQAVDGRTHGHNDYSQHDVETYRERFLPGWTALAAVFRRRGVEVINATPRSAIEDFPYVDFRSAVAPTAAH